MSPFHLRFSGQHEQLDEQPDQPTRLVLVAQHATQGRLRQEQLAQTVAHNATMPLQNNQVQYFRAQLAHRDAQLEHVRSECDMFKNKNC